MSLRRFNFFAASFAAPASPASRAAGLRGHSNSAAPSRDAGAVALIVSRVAPTLLAALKLDPTLLQP